MYTSSPEHVLSEPSTTTSSATVSAASSGGPVTAAAQSAASTASASAATAAPGGNSPAYELLACINCRSRKLKCDRQKPICTRCARSGTECIYPESRRKPAFKRRNVRELEERLAQVEGLLRIVGKQRDGLSIPSDGSGTAGSSPGGQHGPSARSFGSPLETSMSWIPTSPGNSLSPGDSIRSAELLRTGRFESLPPAEMIDELHAVFFREPYFLPIVHPGNYLRSFHSPPHMRPPMCLQYAIWAAASNGHPKYGCYHDALYSRARQYLEADELKGQGEHFITIGHAQAWVLIATDEARCLMFTRAAMSSARAVRLSSMMGLNRLDSTLEESPMAPMITPPQSWVELEERRRLFWGGFCIDNYANISTGWPTLIDADLITTLLPASDEAFLTGTEEKSVTLQDALKGASGYSMFACNAIVSHIFARLNKHAQRPMPDDHPEDPDYGRFWTRHRELDNILSNTFMFMPDRFRLSRNTHSYDPVAIQTNLNLHGAVICLHTAAREKAEKYGLTALASTSATRALTAAGEIVDMIKSTTKTLASKYTAPLMSLSLYFAASVYVSLISSSSSSASSQSSTTALQQHRPNLDLLIRFMDTVGYQNPLTRAYLDQLLRDLDRAGVSVSPDLIPNHSRTAASRMGGGEGGSGGGYSIPLVARTATSRHADLQPPLPGRLPLGKPVGAKVGGRTFLPVAPCATLIGRLPVDFGDGDEEMLDVDGVVAEEEGSSRKRLRTLDLGDGNSGRQQQQGLMGGGHISNSATTSTTTMATTESWSFHGNSSNNNMGDGQTYVDPAPDLFEYTGHGTGWSYATKYSTPIITTVGNLPHRIATPPPDLSIPAGYASFGSIPGIINASYGPAADFGATTTAASVAATLTATTAAAVQAQTNNSPISPDDPTDAAMGGLFDTLREWGLGPDPMGTFYSMLMGDVDAQQQQQGGNR